MGLGARPETSQHLNRAISARTQVAARGEAGKDKRHKQIFNARARSKDDGFECRTCHSTGETKVNQGERFRHIVGITIYKISHIGVSVKVSTCMHLFQDVGDFF